MLKVCTFNKNSNELIGRWLRNSSLLVLANHKLKSLSMRLALITDIHEDIQNLEQAFRKIDKQKIDEIVCLGDISGCGTSNFEYLARRNAHACIALLKANCKVVIPGNHDMHAAKIIPRKSDFFDFPENWYALDYYQRKELGGEIVFLHETSDLDPLYIQSDYEFLRSLPEYYVLKTPELNIFLSHYVFPNLSGMKKAFYTYADEFSRHHDFMKSMDCSISFCGHAHTLGFYLADNKRFKQYKYGRKTLKEKEVCIGLPPVTSLGKSSGICIFDTEDLTIHVMKI